MPSPPSGRAGEPLPREVYVLAAVAFSVAVGFGIVAPAIPVFAAHFGVSHAAAAGVVSAFAGMRLVGAPFAGRLVDRAGERRALATGIGIVAVSSLLAGLSQSYAQLLVLRGTGGLGSIMFSVSGSALLLRVVPAGQRGRAIGLYSGGFLLGAIAGPAFGGLVTDVSLRLPFFLYAGTLAVAGGIGLVALRHTPLAEKERKGRPAATTSLRQAWRQPAFRVATVTNMADAWAVLGVRSAIVPLFVTQGLGLSSSWTGWGFLTVAAVNAATLWPAGRWADTRGRRPVLVAGCAISAGAFVVLLAASGTGAYLVAMGLLGLGSGMLDVAPAALVGDVLAGRGGSVVAAYQMAGDAGAVVGPITAGRLVDATSSYGAAFGMSAALLGLAGVMAATARIGRPVDGARPLPAAAVPAEAPEAGG